MVAKTISGITTSAKETKKRGSIPQDRFVEMIEWISKINNGRPKCQQINSDKLRQAIAYMQLTWCTGLRGCQMALIRKKDFSFDPGTGEWSFTVRKIHDPKERLSGRGPSFLTISIYRGLYAAFSACDVLLNEVIGDDALVCPNYDASFLGGLIKQAAIALEWEEELKFDGVHCLRHGLGETIRDEQGLAAARDQLGHSKQRVVVGATGRYVRSNQARVADVQNSIVMNDEDYDELAGELDEESEKRVDRSEKKSKQPLKRGRPSKTVTTKNNKGKAAVKNCSKKKGATSTRK